MELDKTKFKDDKGRYIVQSLFLENGYNTGLAVFTYDGEDKLYKGRTYISLKKRYLEEGDPEEILFAEKYLFDWAHWQRLTKNALISKHIEEWREELALSLRAEGIATLIDLAINDKSYQAAKWLADEGWVKKTRGRPSKAEIDGELAKRVKIEEQFKDGFELLELHKKENKNG